MKNLSKYRIQSLAVSLAVIGAFGLAIAENGSPATDSATPATQKHSAAGHKKHRMAHKCEAMKKLNISDEQKAKLKELHQASKEQNKAEFEGMKTKFQELRALDKNDPASEAKRSQLKTELKQQREAMQGKRKALMQQVLSAEQMQQWESARNQCKAEWKQKRQQKQSADKQSG